LECGFRRRLPAGRTGDQEGDAGMGEESFALIEKKIGDLVQVVQRLKKENEALAGEVAQKDAEVKELSRKVADLSRERGEVKDRVEKILSRLETVEL
jgi:predicted RNase H-like nuclease (RuvC/YqgF family)